MHEEVPDDLLRVTTRWLSPEERDELIEFLFDLRRPRWRISQAADARKALDQYGQGRVVFQPHEEKYAAYVKLKWG